MSNPLATPTLFEPPRRSARRASPTATLVVAALLTMLLAWVMGGMPVPYVVESPGPTLDTLGEQDGKELIVVENAPTYPTSGKLLMTTVSVYGGPGASISLLRLGSLMLEGDSVIPEHLVFNSGVTESERSDQSAAEQTSSQEAASVAALQEMGTEVPATLTIADTVTDGPSSGKLDKGDVIVEINGVAIVSYGDLVAEMAKVTPGQDARVGVVREGARVQEVVTTAGDAESGALLGVMLDPTFDLPIDLEFNIEGVGGPSAGTMYALGIIDKLTPGSMTGGKVIAGTGTVDAAGRVGAIGGADQKIRAAARDGAAYFLVPTANCGDLGSARPDGIRVVPIDTLHEAREAVEAIAKGSGDLAACPVP